MSRKPTKEMLALSREMSEYGKQLREVTDARITELETLFKVNQRNIRETAQQALGYEQTIDALGAVRRLADRCKELEAQLAELKQPTEKENAMNNKFEKELEELINKHSQENASNTPDFILAQYLNSCLLAFNTATQQRETWYGRDARPTCDEQPAAK